jgi:hypothetical protein
MKRAPMVTDVTNAISADRVDPTWSVQSNERRVRIVTMLQKNRKGPLMTQVPVRTVNDVASPIVLS